MTLGALSDSFYEYLLKLWVRLTLPWHPHRPRPLYFDHPRDRANSLVRQVLSGKRDRESLGLYNIACQAIADHMVFIKHADDEETRQWVRERETRWI